jgi:aldehyde:ferredoxin oxidoreductase
MDKILRIDMGAEGGPATTVEPVGKYAGLGGRAMTSIVVSKEVDPLCHPLSAANKLVFAPPRRPAAGSRSAARAR